MSRYYNLIIALMIFVAGLSLGVFNYIEYSNDIEQLQNKNIFRADVTQTKFDLVDISDNQFQIDGISYWGLFVNGRISINDDTISYLFAPDPLEELSSINFTIYQFTISTDGSLGTDDIIITPLLLKYNNSYISNYHFWGLSEFNGLFWTIQTSNYKHNLIGFTENKIIYNQTLQWNTFPNKYSQNDFVVKNNQLMMYNRTDLRLYVYNLSDLTTIVEHIPIFLQNPIFGQTYFTGEYTKTADMLLDDNSIYSRYESNNLKFVMTSYEEPKKLMKVVPKIDSEEITSLASDTLEKRDSIRIFSLMVHNYIISFVIAEAYPTYDYYRQIQAIGFTPVKSWPNASFSNYIDFANNIVSQIGGLFSIIFAVQVVRSQSKSNNLN